MLVLTVKFRRLGSLFHHLSVLLGGRGQIAPHTVGMHVYIRALIDGIIFSILLIKVVRRLSHLGE